jgi:hypothetical protein
MEIMMIFGGFWRRKTNPIQSQSYLAPRPALGVEKQMLFEKTKPIFVLPE